MSDLKPKAQEDKDGETVSDSPGRHTFSLKNNAAGLSSDEHQNPLNGTQPNPFVYAGVPAARRAGDSLPSGALVNGPASHPSPELHCVLNKGAVFSNSVPDAAWQPAKDTSLQVSRPPSELQSDAWKNTAGPAGRAPATQPGVGAPPAHSEENGSKLEQMPRGRPPSKRATKTRSRRGAERPESSAPDRRGAEVTGQNVPGSPERVGHGWNRADALFRCDAACGADFRFGRHVARRLGKRDPVNGGDSDSPTRHVTIRRMEGVGKGDSADGGRAGRRPSCGASEQSRAAAQAACRRPANTALPSLWRIDGRRKLLLQPAGESRVAADLTCVEADAGNCGCKAFGSPTQAAADFSPSARNLKLDQMFCQGGQDDPASASFQERANQRSPSMRKMSAPLQNTIDSMNGDILPKHRRRLKKQSAVGECEGGCGGSSIFTEDTSEATGILLVSSENERDPSAGGHCRRRQGFSGTDQSPHVLTNEDDGDEDCSDIEQLIIKEEYVEAAACHGPPEPLCTSARDNFDVPSAPAVERKPCPYCPAAFKSGVGLSNHVRGHLHRVGLSYNVRHMVSPEQVALRDHRPQTRRRISAATRKIRKVIKPQHQREYTCPLCGGCFDTKTGLSNHVRGHLKRVGVASTSRSPLCILDELLRDKKEHQSVLQTLQKSQFPPRLLVSQRFLGGGGFLQLHAGIPGKARPGLRKTYPVFESFAPKLEAGELSERKELQVEAQRRPKATSSTLGELLKMRRERAELAAASDERAYANRHACDMTKDYKEGDEMGGVEQNWTRGECDLNRIYIQCNSTFPTAVSLSGNLQAYTCRKRIAIVEEPGYDYKRKKPRPRPGLKRRIFPSLDSEIYTLTCRFCDLVFRGPLSVQEDWIKHLQRHLLHTSVPHSGTGMVEVLGPHRKIEISMSHEEPGFV